MKVSVAAATAEDMVHSLPASLSMCARRCRHDSRQGGTCAGCRHRDGWRVVHGCATLPPALPQQQRQRDQEQQPTEGRQAAARGPSASPVLLPMPLDSGVEGGVRNPEGKCNSKCLAAACGLQHSWCTFHRWLTDNEGSTSW